MVTPSKVVCVFCGSSDGTNPNFKKATVELGELMLQNDWGLVYGGGTTGLMGAVARTIAGGKGYVHGVIPRALMERETEGNVPNKLLYGETTVVEDMHTRKRIMGQQAEAFVALPGGYGTAEELFEVITWNQLGIHDRPIVLLNTDGFYDGLVQWVESALDNGFIRPGNKDIMIAVNTPEEAIEAIKNYKVAGGRFNLSWDSQSPLKS